MARKVRIQYPGAIYHVMNRGDRREAIFEDDEDRERLLQTLTQACQKTEWQVHAYCLMRKHFHLVLETPQPNLVHRFIKTRTHQTTSRSNFFQRCTTGAALISAIPNRILSLSSALDLTRICRRKVCAILPKSVSTRLSQEPCLGV